MHAQTEWLSWAGLFLTYHLLHHIIFHSAQQQQWICSFTALFLLLCFFSLSCIQLAFKQGRLWQGVNPAGGISPSPTKLLLLAIECQCAFLALPDELLDAHYSKNGPSEELYWVSRWMYKHAHVDRHTQEDMPLQTYVCTQHITHFHRQTYTHCKRIHFFTLTHRQLFTGVSTLMKYCVLNPSNAPCLQHILLLLHHHLFYRFTIVLQARNVNANVIESVS